MDKYIGRLLDNRYEILEVIGTGGMAVVYKARCHRLNRLVAIKILKDDYLEDEDFRRRFHAESQAVAMLSHPNIVSVYDVSTSISLEADYIVMELIEGITLKQYLAKKGVLNWKETLHFAIQIAKALEHAHSCGIVHRDIKPHNVMVLKNGSVKVTDFGIARMMSQGNTLTKEALGSVHYISPEQAKGGRVDNRSDIYSLGVVMYEMMSGRPPYDGDSPVAVAIQHINGGAAMPSLLNPNIPGGLEQIIMKAMAHEIEDRYVSAAQMLEDMDEFRKNPSMLFDYHTPPLDVVTQLQKPQLTLQNPKTTAERVVEKTDGVKRRETVRKTEPAKPRRASAAPVSQKSRRAPEEESRSNVATIAIVSCSLVAVVAIVIFLITLLNGGFFQKEKLVPVPALLGKEFAQLTEYPGLEIKKEEVYDETIKAGFIIHQEPQAGIEVVEGTLVVVKVSLGPVPEVITMQNLAGETQNRATDVLNGLNLNLQFEILEEYDDTVEAGSVIRTDPAEGTELTAGQRITLWISKGEEIKTIQMPNLREGAKDVATNILNNQKLKLDIRYEEVFDDQVVAGYVVRTSPDKGEELKTGQVVTLYISKGPEMELMPNVVGMSVETAVEVLKGAGFNTPIIDQVESEEKKVKVINQSHEKNVEIPINTQITIEISKGPAETKPLEVSKDVVIDLRGSADGGDCKVSVTKDGSSVFEQTVPKGTKTITIAQQTGTGPQKYVVIINDQDGWDEWVDFTANG